jgi:hypothetical protein
MRHLLQGKGFECVITFKKVGNKLMKLKASTLILVSILSMASIPASAKYVVDQFTGKSIESKDLWFSPVASQESARWIISNQQGQKEIFNNLTYSFGNNANSERRFNSEHVYQSKVEFLLLLDGKVLNVPISKVVFISDNTSSQFHAGTAYGVTLGGTDYYRTQIVKYTLDVSLAQLNEIVAAKTIKASLRETFEDSQINDFHNMTFDGKKQLIKFLAEYRSK